MNNREIFYRHLGLPSFTPTGLEIESAKGIYLYDNQGKAFMDLVSGISVSNIGHGHPEVIRAITDQAEKHLHLNVYGEYIQSPQVRLARRLTELTAPALDSVYFVNSGSEAIEGALKLAKRYTGRTGIVSFLNGYHGSTHGSLSILGHESLKNAFRPLLPDVSLARFNDPCSLKLIDPNTACVVIELVQAEAGIIPATPQFVHQLFEHCRKTGTLIILDDVQMGMGRTGKLFSYEHFGVVPDILVLAKALGAGMPIGAFIAEKKVMDTLAFNPELGHITTFGGHPLSCAAALAGIEVMLNQGLPEKAEKTGARFEKLLISHPAISAIRRMGLVLGVDLADPSKKEQFMKASIDHGIIIDWFLFSPATFRIAPPLTITEDETDIACRRLLNILDKLI